MRFRPIPALRYIYNHPVGKIQIRVEGVSFHRSRIDEREQLLVSYHINASNTSRLCAASIGFLRDGMDLSIQVLSIGSEEEAQLLRGTLLSLYGCQLFILSDLREFPAQSWMAIPNVVIFHETVSARELAEGAAYARCHWPNARILIIRDGPAELEDHLYDERVSTGQPHSVVASMIRRLAGKDPFRKACSVLSKRARPVMTKHGIRVGVVDASLSREIAGSSMMLACANATHRCCDGSASVHLLNQSTDEMLVLAAQEGSSSAFGELYQRHRKLIYLTVRRISQNTEEAEDLVQETMIRAFIYIQRFRAEAQFSSWLVRIALNAALSRKRSASRHPTASLDEPVGTSEELALIWTWVDTGPNPEQECIRRDLRLLLRRTIMKQPPTYSSIVQACDLQELSIDQAAQDMGISRAAAKSRLNRARQLITTAVRKRATGSGNSQSRPRSHHV
jgi:RNA polymerase sigma-70 factor, ECF subfamily